MKKRTTGVICTLLSLALTGYLLADTFLLRSAYQTDAAADAGEAFTAAQSNLDSSGASDASNAAEAAGGSGKKHLHAGKSRLSGKTETAAETETATETASVSDAADYSSDGISITLEEYTVENTQVYVADVTLSSSASLKTAFAENTYGRNITATTSEMAEENGAILAINGDYYGAQETGYVIRNGVVYRDTAKTATEICCIYADGTMQIKNTADVTAQQLVDEGVWQAFSFGPALIVDGEIAVTADEEVGKAMASNPRTAIGVMDENHYVFVVADGRTDESEGLSLSELAAFLQSLGVQTAYNLDGGGSSTLWYQGSVINNPTTSGTSIKERSVSDIVYIG
ncbi:MAG: phosphodiester glycosidase family protein [Oscillospiraceae bacterium]|nr:phosphodiester glycosidase family protein [Oscillospiraceae bacterium]